MILSIDPSFSSTGVAVADDYGKIMFTKKIEHPGTCYTSILTNHKACTEIADEINGLINEMLTGCVDVICEYPAFATRSGAYLAILNGFLSMSLQSNERVNSITWVGPNACDSFTLNKTHSKTYLVNWCKNNGLIDKRKSHDECTAIIFVKLLLAIRDNKYKNSYFIWRRCNV